MKKGLILEGGAMRGLFSAGVMDVLMENGISFDGIIGVSAGAAFGCNYKSRQVGRVIRYNKKYSRDKRYCSIRSLCKTGDLYGAEFCYHTLPEHLDPFDREAFDSDPTEFYVVCTDVNTGEPVYRKIERCDHSAMEWIRASASMPLVSRVVEIEGHQLLDGGVSDSVPLAYFESIGYEKNLLILTQPKGYRKEKSKALFLMKKMLKTHPAIIKAMEKRHLSYNKTMEQIDRAEQEGRAFVIRPKEKLPVGRIEKDPDKLQYVYDLGRKAAEGSIAQIKTFFA
ncbi:MAG: patatin family protein [Oscillospiraceae bacterium]|nr:patatin family protein [Oscillospiraceae bacterium]MBR6608466.1 patatin family protein [Oscillospiraceae bacterium]